ncbi:hypothetical protein Zm00014a_018784 [Zea mays]|uniref:Uncharacterized protein n=1 Tax=Zea mays TaxID=4577 RepID=A0A3L6EE10_MAIZE|nr:hypothetical protein Zm00014a_018784 [Zea mays]
MAPFGTSRANTAKISCIGQTPTTNIPINC